MPNLEKKMSKNQFLDFCSFLNLSLSPKTPFITVAFVITVGFIITIGFCTTTGFSNIVGLSHRIENFIFIPGFQPGIFCD
jgi:hypothetical protein